MAHFSNGDAVMILGTKIILPTVDVVTDILTINTVLSTADGKYKDELKNNQHHIASNKYSTVAYFMIFFVVLSYILIIPSYLRVEKTLRQKLQTDFS